ncbi:MAG: hypothetical protein RQ750_04295 [Roseovarius sp.]|nr:hypothetical protein [Roseovarius sp.]
MSSLDLLTFNAVLLMTLLSGQAARRAYLGAKPGLDRTAALMMGALGLKLLLDR